MSLVRLLCQKCQERLRLHVRESIEMIHERCDYVRLECGAEQMIGLHIGGGRRRHNGQKRSPFGFGGSGNRIGRGSEQSFGPK